jgi:hypothetical protein
MSKDNTSALDDCANSNSLNCTTATNIQSSTSNLQYTEIISIAVGCAIAWGLLCLAAILWRKFKLIRANNRANLELGVIVPPIRIPPPLENEKHPSALRGSPRPSKNQSLQFKMSPKSTSRSFNTVNIHRDEHSVSGADTDHKIRSSKLGVHLNLTPLSAIRTVALNANGGEHSARNDHGSDLVAPSITSGDLASTVTDGTFRIMLTHDGTTQCIVSSPRLETEDKSSSIAVGKQVSSPHSKTSRIAHKHQRVPNTATKGHKHTNVLIPDLDHEANADQVKDAAVHTTE